MEPSDFARVLNRVKASPNETAALLIGFDGGRALLDHLLVEKMWEALGVPPPPAGKPFRRRDFEDRWFRQHPTQKRELLESHTQEVRVDKEALEILAVLLSEGYVNCIVATDPARGLFSRLDGLGIDLAHFNCSREDSRILSTMGDGKKVPRIFIDGGELLLGLKSSMYDRESSTMDTLKKDLKDYLSRFTNILCWGWTQYNELVDKLFSRPGTHFYVLGQDSENSSTEALPSTIVPDSSGQDVVATTNLFKVIDKCLHPHRRPSLEPRAARPGNVRPPHGVVAAGMDRGVSRCLLIDDVACNSIVKEAVLHPVFVCGVEGDLMRSRLAEKINSAFETIRHRSRFHRSPSFDALAESIRSLDKMKRPFGRIVADFPDRPEAERSWCEKFPASLKTWEILLRKQEASAVVFVPPKWAEAAKVRCGPSPGFHLRFFPAKDWMAESPVHQWLAAQPALESGASSGDDPARGGNGRQVSDDNRLDGKAIQTLARRMVAAAGTPGAATVDWLHEVLEMWLFHLEECQKDDLVDPPQLSLDLTLRVWEELVEAMPQVDPLDRFQLHRKPLERPVPSPAAPSPPPPQPQGEPSFDLGLKRREKPQKEDEKN